jgi:pimeloyl-ACP methyl ester carboxylesterase
MSDIETKGSLNRRHILQGAGALLAPAVLTLPIAAESAARNTAVLYGQNTLPGGVRSRLVDCNGATLHILEAGFDAPRKPCVVLLHGFPELAYTWRNQLLPLAQAGFHVVAPDLRGYGRSAKAPVAYSDDLLPYSMLNRVSDVLALVRALGHERVAAVVGHDWGAPTAQWCARVRPDVFQSVVSMSNPFYRAPSLPLGTADGPKAPQNDIDIDRELAALPRPRKHYLSYSATPGANEDMWRAPQGVHDLLRALFHFKSADWEGNKPFPLKSWTAAELTKMPTYYIMDRDQGIAQTVATAMPSKAQIARCKWMTEADMSVYSTEFVRTGFQGGLNYYRVYEDSRYMTELRAFAGRTLDVPACYLGGDREWAVYQSPGAFEAMHQACSRLLGVHLVKQAGHSIPEEQPEQVNRLLLAFFRQAGVLG